MTPVVRADEPQHDADWEERLPNVRNAYRRDREEKALRPESANCTPSRLGNEQHVFENVSTTSNRGLCRDQPAALRPRRAGGALRPSPLLLASEDLVAE